MLISDNGCIVRVVIYYSVLGSNGGFQPRLISCGVSDVNVIGEVVVWRLDAHSDVVSL